MGTIRALAYASTDASPHCTGARSRSVDGELEKDGTGIVASISGAFAPSQAGCLASPTSSSPRTYRAARLQSVMVTDPIVVDLASCLLHHDAASAPLVRGGLRELYKKFAYLREALKFGSVIGNATWRRHDMAHPTKSVSSHVTVARQMGIRAQCPALSSARPGSDGIGFFGAKDERENRSNGNIGRCVVEPCPQWSTKPFYDSWTRAITTCASTYEKIPNGWEWRGSRAEYCGSIMRCAHNL
eukprot:1417899-Amphidinium_carterae.1